VPDLDTPDLIQGHGIDLGDGVLAGVGHEAAPGPMKFTEPRGALPMRIWRNSVYWPLPLFPTTEMTPSSVSVENISTFATDGLPDLIACG
jgi:hypothetical protein